MVIPVKKMKVIFDHLLISRFAEGQSCLNWFLTSLMILFISRFADGQSCLNWFLTSLEEAES